jgi:hypothetical protein
MNEKERGRAKNKIFQGSKIERGKREENKYVCFRCLQCAANNAWCRMQIADMPVLKSTV